MLGFLAEDIQPAAGSSASRQVFWDRTPIPNVSLDATGLVALADLTTIALRTVLTGNSCLLDVLVLCPGLHRQQSAPELNGGEYAACGSMTSGYVIRVENPATVVFLQKASRTAHLTTLRVTSSKTESGLKQLLGLVYSFQNTSFISSTAYLFAVSMTIAALVLLVLADNHWGIGVFCILILARLLNIVVIRRRAQPGWFGAAEPGVQGDLLILLSQDRWVRMKGSVDDLKTVTSGQWLRDPTFFESSLSALATLLVYLDAALASNVDQAGNFLLFVLLIASAGVLAVANEYTKILQMHGRVIQVVASDKDLSGKFNRRLTMVNILIKKMGRDDWAERMGMTADAKTDRKVEKIVAM
jgi:hypothetical protein